MCISGKFVASVFQLFRSTAFDPETIRTLGDAYERARRSLHDTGQPDLVKEVIAQRIIALAEEGERDPEKLCEGALSALGSKAIFEK